MAANLNIHGFGESEHASLWFGSIASRPVVGCYPPVSKWREERRAGEWQRKRTVRFADPEQPMIARTAPARHLLGLILLWMARFGVVKPHNVISAARHGIRVRTQDMSFDTVPNHCCVSSRYSLRVTCNLFGM